MVAAALFLCFALLFVIGTPVGVALGLAGTLAITLADLSPLAAPTSAYTGIAKYPLLAVPMFVLVGSIFDRSGVALRLVNFASAVMGRSAGSLAARHGDRQHVLGRHLGLRAGQRGGGRRRHDRRAVAGRLPKSVFGERDRGGRRDRHPDPALDRAHHL
jgi:hypothetical protein